MIVLVGWFVTLDVRGCPYKASMYEDRERGGGKVNCKVRWLVGPINGTYRLRMKTTSPLP